MLFPGCAYYLLTQSLISPHGQESPLAIAIGKGFKDKISLVVYALAIPMAFISSWIACGMYISVSLMWLIPDRRIENNLTA